MGIFGENNENYPLLGLRNSDHRPRNNEYNRNKELECIEQDDDSFDEDDDEDHENLKIALFQSIKDDSLKNVSSALKNGATPNATCFRSSITALHLAAFLGRNAILELLRRCDADIKKVDSSGRTALDYAVWNGHNECVKELLNTSKMSSKIYFNVKSTNIYVRDEAVDIPEEIKEIWCNTTPLHLASARINVDCLRLLLEDDSSKTKNLDKDLLSVLDVCGEACKKDGKLYLNVERFGECIRTLIYYEDTLYKPKIDKNQSNPLHKAVYFNCKEVVESIIEVEAYRNGYDESGQTPLHAAIIGRRKKFLDLLINNEDIDCKNIDGFTPLQLAIKCKWRKGINMLLEGGADILVKNNDDDTALHIAASISSKGIIQDLLKKLNDKAKQVNLKNKKGETPLFIAVTSGKKDSVEQFIKVDVLRKQRKNDFNIFTELIHQAIKYDHVDILKLLLELSKKEDELKIVRKINAEYGDLTPLHLAVSENRIECVKILLEYNVDPFEVTCDKLYTTLHIAALKGHLELIKYLMERNSNLKYEKDHDGWKPFHRSIQNGHKECIAYFLEKKENLFETLPKNSKEKYAIGLLINNMHDSINYLENIFDKYIDGNDYELNDERCQITVDYLRFLPKTTYDNQMNIILALLNSAKRLEQKKLLLHPFIETFLYMKWKNNLKPFYIIYMIMFFLYTVCLSKFVLDIYRPSFISEPNISNISILYTSIAYLCFQETCIMVIIFLRGHLKLYFKTIFGLLNWICIFLSISLISINHNVTDKTYPKLMTSLAIILPWFQMTILISYFPKYNYIMQAFAKIISRFFKVIIPFGIFIIIGFALTFIVIFHNKTVFNEMIDDLLKFIFNIDEFDYGMIYRDFEEETLRQIIQLVVVIVLLFLFISIITLILTLIINNTEELEEKIMKLSMHIYMLYILETVISFFTRNNFKIDKIITIYPGKSECRGMSFVSKNLEQSLYSRIDKTVDN